MTKFLAGVLSVIAVGVLLIAYGLLNPPVAAYADQAPFARPMLANETMMLRDNPNAMYASSPAVFGLREPGLCVPGVPGTSRWPRRSAR